MNTIEELMELVPPPHAEPIRPETWRQLEDHVGFALPADYKAIVDGYGLGAFDDFLWVLHPGTANRSLSLAQQFDEGLRALRELVEDGEELPFRVDEEHPDIIPWAVTDNGDVCYWSRNGSDDSATWTVTVNEARGPIWVSFSGSASAFLVAALSKQIRVSVFPHDFPSGHPGFTPLSS